MNAYQPEVVLYVNQNVSNFDVLAYARPQHVFLSHGESDKVYMVSNQAKAYDSLSWPGGRRWTATARHCTTSTPTPNCASSAGPSCT